jgi:hypothetical protein
MIAVLTKYIKFNPTAIFVTDLMRSTSPICVLKKGESVNLKGKLIPRFSDIIGHFGCKPLHKNSDKRIKLRVSISLLEIYSPHTILKLGVRLLIWKLKNFQANFSKKKVRRIDFIRNNNNEIDPNWSKITKDAKEIMENSFVYIFEDTDEKDPKKEIDRTVLQLFTSEISTLNPEIRYCSYTQIKKYRPKFILTIYHESPDDIIKLICDKIIKKLSIIHSLFDKSLEKFNKVVYSEY